MTNRSQRTDLNLPRRMRMTWLRSRRFGIFTCGLVSLAFQFPSVAAEDAPPLRLGDPRLAAAIPSPMTPSGFARGRYLVLEVQRDFARPQDRWVDVVVDASGLPGDLAEYTLEATLSAATDSENLGTLRFPPNPGKALLQADMRRAGVPEAWVVVTLEKDGERIDGVQYRLRAEGPENPLREGDSIPVTIDSPEESRAAGPSPVVIGVPFAPGQLWDPTRLSLQTADGTEQPFQREATGTWIDGGSIQWVQFRALVEPGKDLLIAVDAERAQPAGTEAPLITQTSASQWVLSAGRNRLVVERGHSPIAAVLGNGIPLAQSEGARGLYLVDSKGRLARSAPNAEITIEANGPVHACIRIEADYLTGAGEAVARHITRLESWKDKDGISISHTLILTKDTNELWFKEAGWEFSLPPGNRDALRAVFNVDADDFEEAWEIPIGAENSAAFIFQESHPSIGGGKAVFRAGGINRRGGENIVREGASMGDWGGYSSSIGGLFWAVKDAARQHPKEILVSTDKLNLLLFSNRAGEEMDFRTEALAKRWGVEKELDPGQLEKFRGHTSNAAGWSKTHELLLLPATGEARIEAIAAEAMRLREPVYAMVDPFWIYQSLAMGPLYPCDPERFPDSEAVMREVFQHYTSRVPGERYNGFYDYYAGPHYGHPGRYRLTYSLLNDAWLYAARTGDREARRFAEGANRAFRDNYVNHWDAPGKVPGLFVSAAGGTGGWRKSDFPFYWEEETNFTLATTTSLMQFIWDYQLTGNRRSAEVARNFAEALKTHWKSDTRIWRAFMVLRVLGQAWQFTNDPELLVLLEETANQSVYDPEGEFLMSGSNRPYGSSLYKTNTDVGTMIQLYELLGTQRWHEMALRTSEYWWRSRAGMTPIFRISGRYLNFLYDQTDSAAIAQTVEYNLRLANALWNPETSDLKPVGFSSLDNILQGIPYGMDVVVRSNADRPPGAASLLEYDDYGGPSAWFLHKKPGDHFVLYAQPPSHDAGRLASRFTLDALGVETAYGLGLIHLDQRSDGTGFEGRYAIKLDFPKDAAAAVYRFQPELEGRQFAVADRNIPLVFRSDGYWRPSIFRPAYRYYFQIPENASEPAISLEAGTNLYQPDGELWNREGPVSGRVRLPADLPGLWAMEPVETGLIRLLNLPPYVAMNSPESWFNPESELTMAPEDILLGEAFRLAAAEDLSGLFIGNGRGLELTSSETGEALFDQDQGTIEFYMKPRWGTFDLRRGSQRVIRNIFRVETDRSPWILSYRIDPLGTSINLGPREPSHSFYGEFDTFDPAGGKTQIRAWNTRQIVEPGEWVHIAMVWGPRERRGARNAYTAPALTVYVNGRGQGHALHESRSGNIPSGPVRALQFPADLDAEIRQLRISNSKKYRTDFTPPPLDAPLKSEEDTVLLLPLESDDDGARQEGVQLVR